MSVFIEEPCFVLSFRSNGQLLRPEEICTYGFEKNNACACMGGRVPEDQQGCHGATFTAHSADMVISHPIDQSELGREAV